MPGIRRSVPRTIKVRGGMGWDGMGWDEGQVVYVVLLLDKVLKS